MPLEEILERILKDTEKEEQSIINQNQQEASAILEDARNRSQSIKTDYEGRAKEDADREKKQRISSATLEGRSYLEQQRESIEDSYLDALKTRLIEIRKTDQYLGYIQREIEMAKKVLGKDSILYADQGDAERLKRQGYNSVLISDRIDSLGGAIVTSADGKMIIALTLSETLRKKNDAIRKIVRDYIKE
ncbi:MAG: V-type ATP synthase subunit E family protein [Candidatus Thermoplasmatota archaeon]|nr:V-type ATP synthase subunit E family protein [Candidatus Thermoplasmatota archaeon]